MDKFILKTIYLPIYSSFKNSYFKAPVRLRRASRNFLLIALALVVLIATIKNISYRKQAEELARELQAGPWIHTVSARKSAANRKITIIGETRPYAAVTLYAKVSGYLKRVQVDKGDKVRKDQILAIIESPETDREYQGALADARNKRSIGQRMKTLRARNLVSAQESEQAESDAQVSEARLASLAVQKSYETLRSPFDGTVTSRYADAGALVQNAANSQTSALPVVTVSDVDRLRIYIYLNQRDATFVNIGDPVRITVAERPGFEVISCVTRISGELDTKTRMLLTEIDLDNKQNNFVPGSFVQVTLQLKTPSLIEIPIEALINRQGKTLAAYVKKDNTISYRDITLHSNDGQLVSLESGLEEGDTVALNLGDNLPEGSHVRIMPEPRPSVPK
ncbi:MAG: efflux RND transporter periplasmic adaptor subunit [Bdellovibrionia bacterium]